MENKEIIEVEAEEVTNESFALTVSKLTNQKVASLDKFEVRLKELREKYSKIEIKDATDRAGYDAAKKAKSEIKDMWVGSDKDKDAAKRPLIDAGKLLEEKFQWVIGALHEIAEPIEKRIKWYEDEKKKKEDEEKKLKDKRLQDRVLALLAMGAVNDGVKVSLSDYSADLALIRDTNEEIYKAKIYIRFYELWEALEKIRKAKKEADDLADQIKKDEEIEFKKKQQKLKDDQKLLDDQLAEAAKEKERLKKELIAARSKELFAIGLTYDYTGDDWSIGTAVSISHFSLGTLTQSDWTLVIEEITPIIEKEKISIQEAAQKELERIKQQAIDESETLRKKNERLEIELKEKLAIEGTDKEKYKEIYDYLKKAPVYEFKSDHFRAKYRVVRDFLADLK